MQTCSTHSVLRLEILQPPISRRTISFCLVFFFFWTCFFVALLDDPQFLYWERQWKIISYPSSTFHTWFYSPRLHPHIVTFRWTEMSNPLSHASLLPFLVPVKGAELHALFKTWKNHGFVWGHNDSLICFQFLSQEFLACGSLSWWLLNAKVTFLWICLSYPKGIAPEWHRSTPSPS